MVWMEEGNYIGKKIWEKEIILGYLNDKDKNCIFISKIPIVKKWSNSKPKFQHILKESQYCNFKANSN